MAYDKVKFVWDFVISIISCISDLYVWYINMLKRYDHLQF